ncbi:response regulator transcription factor [Nocardioides litoris]|uniref:response regulator transcription factor n=1 Tax=Nocardioides litoris TaxID=1926648 RepID=UPI00111E0C85|nr:response regulator transcription factor [Nocardioides litoris]
MPTTASASGVPLLVVEDDPELRTGLERALGAAGFVVRTLADGSGLEDELDRTRPALVVLDWMLPGRQGPDLVAVVRRRSAAAVVMLTARESVEDRLRGFGVGVDDYLAKPFVVEELVARVRAVLRRSGALPSTIEVGDLVVDEDAARVTRAGEPVVLTPTELRLLVFLAHHRGRVLSSTQILSQVWGYDTYADNLVQVHVSSLRKKLEAHGPRMLHTERGLGYVLRAAP